MWRNLLEISDKVMSSFWAPSTVCGRSQTHGLLPLDLPLLSELLNAMRHQTPKAAMLGWDAVTMETHFSRANWVRGIVGFLTLRAETEAFVSQTELRETTKPHSRRRRETTACNWWLFSLGGRWKNNDVTSSIDYGWALRANITWSGTFWLAGHPNPSNQLWVEEWYVENMQTLWPPRPGNANL